MHDAARDFQAQFTIARFDAIRCMSLVRVPGGGGPGDLTDAQVDARRRLGKAIDALGGLGSPAGSCVWHVVGLQRSIREWAMRQGWGGKPVRVEQAQGILSGGGAGGAGGVAWVQEGQMTKVRPPTGLSQEQRFQPVPCQHLQCRPQRRNALDPHSQCCFGLRPRAAAFGAGASESAPGDFGVCAQAGAGLFRALVNVGGHLPPGEGLAQL